MEEKFRILNNDELADALQVRLNELSSKLISWTPEILLVFLQLSERPAQESRVEDLHYLQHKIEHAPLSWSQIVEDDHLDNQGGLWDNVDFAVNESEEDCSGDIKRSPSPESTSSLHSCNDPNDKLLDLIITPQDPEHCEIESPRFWQAPSASPAEGRRPALVEITECQMIRESLFMLRGLPTSVYVVCENTRVLFSRQYCIARASNLSLVHLLGAFANIGTQLSAVRSWIRRAEVSPLLQTFQAALAVRMAEIDRELTALEARTLDYSAINTLLSTTQDVFRVSRHMQEMAELLQSVNVVDESQVPYKILELLYDKTCLSQSTGDMVKYIYMAKLFLECFHTYLKPVQLWMESGELIQWRHAFFVSKNEDAVSAECLWRDQFGLVHTKEGHLHAPKFLRFSALKILNTGKIVNFRKKLGRDTSAPDAQSFYGCGLDLKVQEEPETLRPFSELFEVALDDWVSSRHRSLSFRLRQQLITQCCLQSSLDALEYIFFCRNASLTHQPMSAIFDRLDRGRGTWNDRFVLTGLFRNAFSALTCIDVQRVTVRSHSHGSLDQEQNKSVKALQCFSIHYSLNWSVANILRSETFVTYQRISTFLIQIQRAKYVLEGRNRVQRAVIPPRCGERQLATLLRYRLLWFTNLLYTYLTEIVLSTSTSQMRVEMLKAEDIDEMVAVHEGYIIHLQDQCLLSQKLMPIQEAILSLLDLAITLAQTYNSWSNRTLAYHKYEPTAHSSVRSVHPISRNRTSISSSSDGEDLDGHPHSSPRLENRDLGSQRFHLIQLKTMHQSYERLYSFVLAGLRAVHRTGTDPSLEVLADLLDHRPEKNKGKSGIVR